MKISPKWSIALIAATLSAAEVDPRLLRLIGPDTQFVGGIDAERYAGSQLAKIFPSPASLRQTPIRFMMEITNSAGRTLSVTVHAAPVAHPETEAAPLQYHGARIWKSDESADALLDASTTLHGDAQSITDAIDRWSFPDTPLSVPAAKASLLSRSYDVWFLAIKPLDVPDGRTASLPLKHRAELVQSIEEVRAGIRLGAIDDARVDVDAKSSDEATALAVIGRYLPGFMEMQEPHGPQSALLALVDRVVSRSEGRTAVLSVSIEEFRIEEWTRAQKERER